MARPRKKQELLVTRIYAPDGEEAEEAELKGLIIALGREDRMYELLAIARRLKDDEPEEEEPEPIVDHS